MYLSDWKNIKYRFLLTVCTLIVLFHSCKKDTPPDIQITLIAPVYMQQQSTSSSIQIEAEVHSANPLKTAFVFFQDKTGNNITGNEKVEVKQINGKQQVKHFYELSEDFFKETGTYTLNLRFIDNTDYTKSVNQSLRIIKNESPEFYYAIMNGKNIFYFNQNNDLKNTYTLNENIADAIAIHNTDFVAGFYDNSNAVFSLNVKTGATNTEVSFPTMVSAVNNFNNDIYVTTMEGYIRKFDSNFNQNFLINPPIENYHCTYITANSNTLFYTLKQFPSEYKIGYSNANFGAYFGSINISSGIKKLMINQNQKMYVVENGIGNSKISAFVNNQLVPLKTFQYEIIATTFNENEMLYFASSSELFSYNFLSGNLNKMADESGIIELAWNKIYNQLYLITSNGRLKIFNINTNTKVFDIPLSINPNEKTKILFNN